MRKAAALVAVLASASPVVAQNVLDTPGSAGALIANACVTQSLDFPAILERATSIADQLGLPAVTKMEKVAMYGNPGASHVVFTREVDSLACALKIPAPIGNREYYEVIRTRMQAMIDTVYAGAKSVDHNKPSPHEAQHDWVFSVPRDRHFAVSLQWQTDDGVSLGVGYSQIYE